MKSLHWRYSLYTLALWCAIALLHSCFLVPMNPGTTPDGYPPFSPTVEWVKPVIGPAMDVSPVGNIVSIGDITNTTTYRISTVIQTYNPTGMLIRTSFSAGLSKEVLAPFSEIYDDCVSSNVPDDDSKNYRSLADGVHTNPYTRYNTDVGGPDTDPYPYSGYVHVVGPSMAQAFAEQRYFFRPRNQIRTSVSVWVVGTFCDFFQPSPEYFEFGDPNRGKILFHHLSPTLGKADCFILRTILRNEHNLDDLFLPVRLQWGGPENDIAYDVAADTISGSATIFIRAGSPFSITSATLSPVQVQTGYNIVRLNMNGLLTETFPVALQAQGEISDAQIALAKGGSIYILAKDEQRKQYFLTKVNRSATLWMRYLPAEVSNDARSIPSNRSARMGLTVDSQDCVYITGNFSGTVDLGGISVTSQSVQAFVAKYSPEGSCLGALPMGGGLGVTVRLSPNEDALYVNGWAAGSILGTPIPSQDNPSRGILRPGAFLVKLKLK